MPNTPLNQRLKTLLGALLTAIIATGVIGPFDYFFLGSIVGQLRTQSYPTTTGTILHSSVETTADSEGGNSHRPEITFAYEIDGKNFESSAWRHGNLGLSDPSYAEEIVARYSPGSEVIVHYNPNQPDDAVLSTELDSSDAFLMLFMTVPNLLIAGAWGLFCYWLRVFITDPPAGGVKIIERRDEIRARLPRLLPIVAFAGGVIGVPFVSVFIAGFALHMAPSFEFVYGVWIVAPVAGAAAFAWQAFALSRGEADLIINRRHRTLSLPPVGDRSHRLDLPLDHVRAVRVRGELSASGESTQRYFAAHLTVASADGAGSRDELAARFTTRTRADGFSEWLRGQVGLLRAE